MVLVAGGRDSGGSFRERGTVTTRRVVAGLPRAASTPHAIVTLRPCCPTVWCWWQVDATAVAVLPRARNCTTRRAGPGRATGSLNTARHVHTATLLPSGMVLVAGGLDSSSLFQHRGTVRPGERDLDCHRQPQYRTLLHTATLLPDGLVLVAGGLAVVAFPPPRNFTTRQAGPWTGTGNLNTARIHTPRASCPAAMVLIAGGLGSGGMLPPPRNFTTRQAEPGPPPAASTPRAIHTPRPSCPTVWCWSQEDTIAVGPSANAELYDPGLGFVRPDWQPQIATATSPLVIGSSFMLTGSRFQGISQASGGNFQDSSSNYPVVQLRNIDNGQVAFLPVDPVAGWSDTAFTSDPSE